MTDKVMIIVGAGPGISLAAAKKFGSVGFKIALIARRLEALQQYEAELSKDGIEIKWFSADAGNEASLQMAIETAIEAFGRADVLLYNAASGKPGQPTALSSDDLVHDFKISVSGALTAVNAVIPHMNKGSILLTGGGLALHPYSDLASLSIGKAGIRSLAFSLHQDLKPREIYVGTLTIKGFVQNDTFYSAENIAEAYYKMYQHRDDAEIIYEEQ